MSKFDRKVKRAKTKKEDKIDKWEDLIPIRNDAVNSYMNMHSILVEVEKKFKENINQDIELKQAVKGLNETYVEIANNIADIQQRHIIELPPEQEGGEPIKKFRTGEIKADDDEFLDYIAISNEYSIALSSLLNSGVTAQTALLDKLKVFSSNIKESDIALMKNLVKEGQEQLMSAHKMSTTSKRKRKKAAKQ